MSSPTASPVQSSSWKKCLRNVLLLVALIALAVVVLGAIVSHWSH